MKLSNVIFINNYPTLDLHGFDRDTAKLMINDFIDENKKLKKEIIVIVHGKGTGALKETTHCTLKENYNIDEYKTYYNNDGCTIAKIIID